MRLETGGDWRSWAEQPGVSRYLYHLWVTACGIAAQIWVYQVMEMYLSILIHHKRRLRLTWVSHRLDSGPCCPVSSSPIHSCNHEGVSSVPSLALLSLDFL